MQRANGRVALSVPNLNFTNVVSYLKNQFKSLTTDIDIKTIMTRRKYHNITTSIQRCYCWCKYHNIPISIEFSLKSDIDTTISQVQPGRSVSRSCGRQLSNLIDSNKSFKFVEFGTQSIQIGCTVSSICDLSDVDLILTWAARTRPGSTESIVLYLCHFLVMIFSSIITRYCNFLHRFVE